VVVHLPGLLFTCQARSRRASTARRSPDSSKETSMTDLTPGTWPLDPTHTSASFTVRHAGISKVRGQFTDVEGALTVGEGGEDLAFTAALKTASVNTSNTDRDNHLRSGDFFDAETFPEIRFASTAVKGETLTGDL